MKLAFVAVVLSAFAHSASASPAWPVLPFTDEPATALSQEQDAPTAEERAQLEAMLKEFSLEPGPMTGKLGTVATIEVPEGLAFTSKAGTAKFLLAYQNTPGGNELGMILSQDEGWFVIFTYDASGHVKDDEKDDLDAGDLLETIQENQERANEARKSRGWEPFEIAGWHKEPFYDSATNNLTWSLIVRSPTSESINWSTKLLGRVGKMDVDLVTSREQIDAVVPTFNTLMKGFTYVEGQRYAEFKEGDKLAEYGLAALVAGGAGAIAAKTGLLAKFWKLIVGAVVVVAAFFKRIFGFGKKGEPGEGTA